MKLNRFSALAIATLFAAPVMALNDATQTTGKEAPGEEPKTTDCTHTGADWQDAKVVNSGSTQCASYKFELTVGANGVGGQLTVTWHGCPAFLDKQPGHGKHVTKANHNAVNKQELNWTRQEYTADCGGWFSSATCKPKGAPKDLDTTVDHWQEQGCGIH